MSNIEARLGIWRATLIQKDRSLDSIIANVLLVGDFIDSIDQTLSCEIG